MGHIVARHRGDREDRKRTGSLEVDRLLIPRSEGTVEVAWIPSVRRNLLHGDGDLLHGIGEVGHIGQQHQHLLAIQGKLLGNRKRNVGNQQAFHGRITSGMHEENGPAHGSTLFQGIPEIEVIVVLETHSAEDDEIDFGLHGDSCQHFVVGFPGNGEYGQLLRFNQCIEHIDHRKSGTDHIAGNDAHGGIHRRTTDLDEVLGEFGSIVPRFSGTGEHPTEEIFTIGNPHRISKEPHLVSGGDTPRASEHL